jgi:ATP phosphoribosyltransferase regulatory subunit
MGLEHLGGDPRAADAEVLAIAAECLDVLGVRGFVLALGHVGVFGGLLAGAPLEGATLERLRERVEAKDAVGVRAALPDGVVPAAVGEALVRLATLSGDASVLAEAERVFAFCPPARAAVAELKQVVDALRSAGLGDGLAVDLGEVRGLDYYTGLVFRAYAPGLGLEVGGGGRYDTLLARFGRPMPAVGFMLGLDRLALLLDRQGARPAAKPPAVEVVGGNGLGAGLQRAREKRAAGVRVRFEERS